MATARRRRAQRTDDDEFEIALEVALELMLAPGHITEGADWHFTVEGTNLIITRTLATRDNDPPED